MDGGANDRSDPVEGTVVIGAGPGGLATAYELGRRGFTCDIFEAGSQPGGIARTKSYKGCLFDLGGHRFFTKIALVQRMWDQILGEDFLLRPRLSRIYFNSRFFRYPLSPWDALSKLGPIEAARCIASYLAARLRPISPEQSFADWVCIRFGHRLFNLNYRMPVERIAWEPAA